MSQHDAMAVRRPRTDNQLLRKGGFTDVEVKRTFGYWSIVTERKP